MANEWPTLGAELARKSIERATAEVERAGSGGDMKRFWVALDVLCDVTQGLIPSEDWNLIYDARQSAKEFSDV